VSGGLTDVTADLFPRIIAVWRLGGVLFLSDHFFTSLTVSFKALVSFYTIQKY